MRKQRKSLRKSRSLAKGSGQNEWRGGAPGGDLHLQITRDRQRQFKREANGRFTWNQTLPKPPRVAGPISRQQRRYEERRIRKAERQRLKRERLEFMTRGDNWTTPEG